VDVINLLLNWIYHQQTTVISFSRESKYLSLIKRLDENHTLIMPRSDRC